MARTENPCRRIMTGSVAAGFGAGFAIDLPAIGTLVGTLVGAGGRLRYHRASAGTARRPDPATLPRPD